MSLSPQLGYPLVPNSITNPNVLRTNALDVGTPMAFLTFIKILNVNFSPDVLQTYYTEYLKSWNYQNSTKGIVDDELIVEKYRDFVKALTINYTTLEEKEFLSKIDYNDPFDLDILITFCSKKLVDISNFYNSKRHDLKYGVIRSKLVGTNFGTTKTIEELVLSYLKNLELGALSYNYNTIQDRLEIEIEELYDTYPLYFNQTPNSAIYDYKNLDYGQNIFLKDNTTLISEIFSGLSFELKTLKEVDQLFDNKRALTEKYLSTDYYFLSTGATVYDILSGKLLSNSDSSGNLLNRSYPTTASTEHPEYLQTSRSQGFFRPSNTTIILVDGITNTYKINYDNLAINSLYFFPDPNITGNNGDTLTFIADDSYLKRNMSSGSATNQPTSNQYDTKYYGYTSKIEPSIQKGLDIIHDTGYIKDFKSDIYGNLFGLFINDGKYTQTIEQSTITPSQTSVLFNGYQFYDDIYGLGTSFNYLSTYSCSSCSNTITSGLSTYTGSLSTNVPDLILNFGDFTHNQELAAPTESWLIPQYHIIENGFIMNGTSTYSDPVSSDLSAFQTSILPFYYTELIECGLNSPTQRALYDSAYPTLTANLSATLREPAMNIVDGGWFDQPFPNYEISPASSYYDDTLLMPTNMSTDTNGLYNGLIYVKNSMSRAVDVILDSIPFLTISHSVSAISQINDAKINKFDVSGDILVMETDNWLTIDKIKMEAGEFVNPKVLSYELFHSSNLFDRISNRLKVQNFIYFVNFTKVEENPPYTSNNFYLFPNIYAYNTLDNTITILFNHSLSSDDTMFNVLGGDIRYIISDAPIITYDSRSNIFLITLTLRDQNDMIVIHDYKFYIDTTLTFIDHNITTVATNNVSNIFGQTYVTYYSPNAFTTLDGELILT